MRNINLIVVHCSATREGYELTPEALEASHLSRGFRCTGYHYYIRRNGRTLCTRPVEWEGAHVHGHNKHSIGICYEGGLTADGHPADTRTKAQRKALYVLVQRLRAIYPGSRVCGHRDLSPDQNGDGIVEPEEWIKVCPCFDVATEL